MKKTYIVPYMETNEIKKVNVLSASNPKVHKTGLDPESAEGRRFNDNFEEEEDNI